MIIGTYPERSRYIKPARTVIGREIVVQRTAVLVHELRTVLETQTFTLCLFQRDAHDRLYRGGIAGSRVLHHINVLDLIGAQAREFLHVLHPTPVDIHLSITASQHLHTTVALSFERRNLRECIVYGSGFLQYRTSDGGAHGVTLHMRLRQLPLHHDLAEQFGILLHLDGQPLARVYI